MTGYIRLTKNGRSNSRQKEGSWYRRAEWHTF